MDFTNLNSTLSLLTMPIYVKSLTISKKNLKLFFQLFSAFLHNLNVCIWNSVLESFMLKLSCKEATHSHEN
jgi:hypothetical protein